MNLHLPAGIPETKMIITICLLPQSYIEATANMREQAFIAFGKWVVARLKVCLALGETNDIWWITRSVIHLHMHEQSLATAAQDICRAFKQPFDPGIAHKSIVLAHENY